MPLFANRTHAEFPGGDGFGINEVHEDGAVISSRGDSKSSGYYNDVVDHDFFVDDHDSGNNKSKKKKNVVIIVGAGPAGLGTAACLRARGVPFVILERSASIASLWKHKTYDRLKMHIAKEFCRLPLLPFPNSFPTFISKNQFLDYLDSYVTKFDLHPRLQETVTEAKFDKSTGTWLVETAHSSQYNELDAMTGDDTSEGECNMVSRSRKKMNKYAGRWLVVATGENAEMVVPKVAGMNTFRGSIIHSSEYRNGSGYHGQKVLVIGAGNSGMEISLDLSNFGAKPSIIIRSPMHILPLEIFGKSTFSVAQRMLKAHLPLWFIDQFLVSYSRVVLGDTSLLGIHRPKIGPMALKLKQGKTPVLDVGTLERIRDGRIKVVATDVECITEDGLLFKDGHSEKFDSIVLATGYRSNVLDWLKEDEDDVPFFKTDSTPGFGNSNHWKSKNGLYVAGLSKRGILGCTTDAELIAEDICNEYFNHNAAIYMK